ncbi:ATP-grasp domain-containing protein [Streptomyces sp. M92]|uniref:ATP-grasp domain-containing protein n=1 Tax=Streptomyces sp. M92 TaxID=2944250 RepID=UPI00234BDEAA|nr:ATP-grasp domain-containing protein [Streptomyces sp. M92]WCN02085.1 ATP-grasp domain-containing protein [Streptomyces sp. M92]
MATDLRSPTTRVALVDAYSAGNLLVPALNREGVECVHVRSPEPDVNMVKLKFPDGFLDDIRHEGDLTATAAALREWGIGCVIAGGESGVELADQLNAELGTPGNGMSRPTCRRNKYEMVLAVRDGGLPHAATIVSPDADEIIAWAETTAGYPVVLKPVSSAGQDNVMACASAEEVRAAHDKIRSSTNRQGQSNTVVLAQEFLAGTEYFVNTVSRDGRHHTAEIWRYCKRRIPGGHIIHDYVEPLSPDDPDAQELESYSHRILDALEIHNGAAHVEIMMTADGPVLVECAGRLGGGAAPQILSRSMASNQIDLIALSVARPDEFNRLPASLHRLLRHTLYVHLINPNDHGIAPSHEDMGVVRALPSWAHTVLMHPEGAPLTRTVDFPSQPGYVILISDDPVQLRADYEKLREIERVLYAGNPVPEQRRPIRPDR